MITFMPFSQSYLKALATTTGIALLALSSSITHAQSAILVGGAPIDSNKYGVSVGLNVLAGGSPYEMDSNFSILPSLFYDNNKFYVRGSELGAYLTNSQDTEVAAFFQPAGYAFKPEDAKESLRGLDEREWSGMMGVSYLKRTAIGGFRGKLSTDVLGNSKGTLAQLAYLAKWQKGDWTVYPSVGVEWADDKFNDHYYGVSAKEAAATGVATYNPDSSISPYVNINANYDINDDWAVFLGQNVGFLASEQADSPMVDNSTTYRTTLGLLYKF